ncbi:GH92 family glycosyl hydrolase [Companilactobacillus jidongensis]|uniref:GH92 family glycosyl hydrolase n=1 Tax=Companilactobacillus jidongensis TaxID=2486006 RepID=UPI000F78CF9C|nr:GH92 family glycosyl hydrolase [Companilactobacillus jidongensis]
MNIENIDTRHGTNNSSDFSHGNTLPYTGVPFGMNYFCVQTTDEDTSWFFKPTDHNYSGIRLTHQPSPWIGDFQQLTFTAISESNDITDLNTISGSYNSDEAIFQPNYLRIKDQRYGVTSELTASTYGANVRYSFHSHDNGFLLKVPKAGRFTVKNNQVLVTVQNYTSDFSDNFVEHVRFNFDAEIKSTQQFETEMYDLFLVNFGDIDELNMTLAASFISQEQAQLNLSRIESDFEISMKSAAAEWQKYFDLIEIDDPNKQNISTFYHNLYRIFLFPQRCYELNKTNEPVHFDIYNKNIKTGFLYMNNGFWDTSKTVYPLFSILIPETFKEMLDGFYNSYLESGFLPKWLAPDERGMMPGTLIDAVVADAAIKGLLSIDKLKLFLKAMIDSSTKTTANDKFGRQGATDYDHYGYLPADKYKESVNNTLDYAYSDFCISQVAQVIGETEIQQKYFKSAMNYQNLFDSETGLMRAKLSNGKFKEPFDSLSWGTDYTEGSSWQNSFSVFHDIDGLRDLYKDKTGLRDTLVQLCNQAPAYRVGGYGFEIHEMTEMAQLNFGQLALSNQPSFHIPYLFMYTDKSEYTSILVKQLMKKFNDTIDGYPGDEDNGSMSAWYIFSALGFYPVCPGSDQYIVGIPQFDRVELNLANNKQTTIITKNNLPQNQFNHLESINDKSSPERYITHEQITAGSKIINRLTLLP